MKKIRQKEIHNIFEMLKNGQKNIAINNLYKNYHQLIINIAFSIVKNRTISEEISQIVFMKTMQLPNEKIPNHSELNWLYYTTKNITIEYLKKNNNFFNINSIYNITDSQVEIIELIDKESFNKLINNIDDTSKEIVSLKIFSNFSFQEIGKMIKVSPILVILKYYKSISIKKRKNN